MPKSVVAPWELRSVGVATSEGDAAATRSDGSVVPLVVDDPVYQGDVVVTGVGSAVGLVFNDDTTFSLGEQGRMVLGQTDL